MAETPQTEQETEELLLAGTIAEEEWAAFIQAYYDKILPDTSPDAPALMLLEEQPQHIVEPDKRQNLLRFASFEPKFDFTSYTSGRFFHSSGELHWERRFPDVQVVYTGHRQYRPQLRDATETSLDGYIPTDRAYFLFGKRLDQKQLDLIRPAAQQGDFAEVRIPRLLRYPQMPVLRDAERVRLVVCEYIDPATALNVTYRFKSLETYKKQSETTGAKKA